MLDILNWKVEIGQGDFFGTVHIIALILVVVAIITAIIFTRKMSDSATRKMLLIFGFTELFLEIVRQIIGIVGAEGAYNWQWFPFQLCSTVIYITIITGFLKKDSVIKKSFYLYMATYGFFGGFLTMLVAPMIVFSTSLGIILIQTTVVHVLMIFVSVHLFVSNKINFKRINYDFITKAVPLFVSLSAIAVAINCIIDWTVGTNGIINMFFINPYTRPVANPIPIFNTLNLPYVAWLLIFLVGYSLLSFGFFWAARGIQILSQKIGARKSVDIK